MEELAASILIVDDDWLTRLQVKEMLRDLGYHVAGVAESGRQAFEMAGDLKPDLILMDVVMPGMNGIEAGEKIKSEFNIPIIFISGYAEPELIEKAKEIEPFGYVMKPFDEKEVRAFIEIALHKRKMEEALRESEEKYREFIEWTDDLITQINSSAVFTFANHTSERILGIIPDQLVGMSALDFVYPEDREKTEKLLTEFIVEPKAGIIFENRQVNQATGEVRHINWTINPHYDGEGRIIYYNNIGRDLTDQKKLEDAAFNAKKLKSLGVLAGGIAHDFNNLMASILGNIGLAKLEMKPRSKAFENLVKAEKASLNTKALTARLITFSEGGGPSKEIVAIGAKNKLPLKNGKYVKISIKDHGNGIPQKNIGKIFDPYFTTKEMGIQKGMGLGLAISDSIVKKHDGLITVASQLGKGTTLSTYLPAIRGKQKGPGASVNGSPFFVERDGIEDQPTIVNHPSAIKKVLVMDDEKVLRDVAYSILTRLGYEVAVAMEGVETIEMYGKAMASGEPFDLVILDLTNKIGMGGIETIERLLKIDHAVRAVVSTGYSNNPILRNFREYGFRIVLLKPFTFEELKAVIS